jgi:hypothetical protein
MIIYQLFAMAANNIRERYLDLAGGQKETNPHHSPDNNQQMRGVIPVVTDDRFAPSTPLQNPDTTAPRSEEYLPLLKPAPETASHDAIEKPEDTPEENEHPQTKLTSRDTYFFRQKTKLDYRLKLSFDLQAVSRTLVSLAEGDNEAAVQDLAAGNFGLGVDFKLKGKQDTLTNMLNADSENLPAQQMHNKTKIASRQVQQIALQSRDFAVQAFYRQATKVMNSLKVTERDNFRHSVSKFAYRFTLDSKMSFAFLQRFNVQTGDVAAEIPEAVNGYVTSAGTVAEKGTTEMISAFFDAVDAYLDGAEDQIVERVNRFFDMAQQQLGVNSDFIEQARDNLLETVENFFDRVDNALDTLQSFFIPEEMEEPGLVQPVLTTAPDEPVNPEVNTAQTLTAVS